MKAWKVIAITIDGEMACEDCLQGHEEREAFNGKIDEDIGVVFASDATEDDRCTRCGKRILDG